MNLKRECQYWSAGSDELMFKKIGEDKTWTRF